VPCRKQEGVARWLSVLLPTLPAMNENQAAAIAWAAGIIEGEGSIVHTQANGGRPGRQRRIAVKMTDLDVLQRLQQVLGAGHITGPHRLAADPEGKWKPCYAWNCSRWEDIERVLRLIRPWLCERRGAAADRLLADPAGPVGSPPLDDACRKGHPRTIGNTYVAPGSGIRHCRPCQREYKQRYLARRRAAEH
jgi:hypothetical protein